MKNDKKNALDDVGYKDNRLSESDNLTEEEKQRQSNEDKMKIRNICWRRGEMKW